jgi:class 3 adenylate cyclase/predicted ATPase
MPQHVTLALPTRDVGEYKVVTFLSCQLADGSAIDSRARLDTLHTDMRLLYDRVQHTALRYGGHVQLLPDRQILAVFGAPDAQEDHAHRAVLAALELRQHLGMETGPGQREEACVVRMGLHSGLVAVGGIDSAPEGETQLIGDIALRAMSVARHGAPGAIQCSEMTASLLQGSVDLLPPQPLPGQDETATEQVYRIVRWQTPCSPPVARQLRTETPFQGRDRELDVLHTVWARVEAGQGHVLGIVGESGMGKSRLVYEFRRSLPAMSPLYIQGRCLSYGQTTPYFFLRNLLRHAWSLTEADRPVTIATTVARHLRRAGIEPDDALPYLLHLLGVPIESAALATFTAEEIKAGTFDLLCRMVVGLSQQRPLVLEVEDLHWIDATSEAWLTQLAQQLFGVPILLLVTSRPGSRPGWIAKSYATQLALTRLTPDDSQKVVRALLPRSERSGALVHDIVAKAEGNPFFLEELAQSVAAHGARHVARVLPDTIQAVLTARIDQLPRAEKRLLQLAAVIGPVVPSSLLHAVSELPSTVLRQQLRELQNVEFLCQNQSQRDPTYMFKHVLCQEAAYQSLLTSARQHFHLQIARVLEKQCQDVAATHPERVAHHYTEAGHPEQACAYWYQAGMRAINVWANAEAVSHLQRGLDLLQTLPDTPERPCRELALLIALGRAMRATKGPAAPEVEQLYLRADALCQSVGTPEQTLQVLHGLRGVSFSRPDFRRARELGLRCLHLAHHIHQPSEVNRAHYTLGITLFCLGQVHKAYGYLKHAARSDTAPELQALAFMAYTLWLLGYPNQARHWSHQALRLAQASASPLQQAAVLGVTARFHLQCRDIDEVGQRAETLVRLAREQRLPYWMAQGLILQGWSHVAQGRWVTGLAQMQQGLADCQATGAEVSQPYYLACLAEAYGMSQRFAAAQAVLAEALAIARAQQQALDETRLHWLKATLLMQEAAQGHLAVDTQKMHGDAELHLHQALAIARRHQAKMWKLRAATSLSRLWLQHNKQRQAERLLTPIYCEFTEGWDTVDLQAAKTLLDELQAP